MTQEEKNRNNWICCVGGSVFTMFFERFCNGKYDDAPSIVPAGFYDDRICQLFYGHRLQNFDTVIVNTKYSIQDIYKAVMHQYVWIKYILGNPQVKTIRQVWNVLEHHNVSDIDPYDAETWQYIHETHFPVELKRWGMKDVSDVPPVNFHLDKERIRGMNGLIFNRRMIPEQMEFYNIGMILIDGILYQEVKIKGRRAIRRCEEFTIEEFLDLSTITKEDYEFAKTVNKLDLILNAPQMANESEESIEAIIKDYQTKSHKYAPLLAPEIVEEIRKNLPSHIPSSSRELCMAILEEMAMESWGYHTDGTAAIAELHNNSGIPSPPRAGP